MWCTYFAVDLIVFLFIIVSFGKGRKNTNLYLLLSCLLWALIFGLRAYTVGNDTAGYAGFYNGTNTNSNGYGTALNPGETIEWGFVFIGKILWFFTSNATVGFLLHGLFTQYIIYLWYKDRKTSVMCYLWLMMFGSMISNLMVAERQSWSICFQMLSLILFTKASHVDPKITRKTTLYLKRHKGIIDKYANRHPDDKKYRRQIIKQFLRKHIDKKYYEYITNKFFLWGVVSLLFSITVHRSGIIFGILIPILYFIKLNKKTAYIVLTSALFVAIVFTSLLNEFYTYITLIVGSSEDENIALLAERYNEMSSEGASIIRILSLYLPTMVTIYYSNRQESRSIRFKFLVFGMSLYMILSGSTIVSRMIAIFIIVGYSIIVPQAAAKSRTLFSFYLLCTIYWLWRSYAGFYQIFSNPDDCLVPYKFIFD